MKQDGEWHILRPSHLWERLNYRLDKIYSHSLHFLDDYIEHLCNI